MKTDGTSVSQAAAEASKISSGSGVAGPVAPIETVVDPAAAAATTAAATTTPAKTSTAAETSTPAKTTTAPTDKRRTSFFGGVGSKKERKAGAVSGDESTDGEKKASGGFGNLLRKASRATPKNKTSSTAVTPVVPSTGTTKATESATAAETKAAEPAEIPLPEPAEGETKTVTATSGPATVADKVEAAVLPTETGATSAGKSTEAAKTVEATA